MVSPELGLYSSFHAYPVDEQYLTPAYLTLPGAKERGKVDELQGKLEKIKASVVRLAELAS